MDDMWGGDKTYLPGGLVRRVFKDAVQFLPKYVLAYDVEAWDYGVYRFAFVPGFHVCTIEAGWADDIDYVQETILSTHKTLHEAMGVCKLLLANGGVTYVGD